MAKFAGLFVVVCFFRHVVRVFGLENIKRQRGHYTFGLFFGATDFMKKLCLSSCWRGVPYGGGT